MVVTELGISLDEVANSGAARLDPRYHHLYRQASPVVDSILRSWPLGRVASFRNGINLPRASYADDDEEPTALYASVAAIAAFVFRRESCVAVNTVDGLGEQITDTNFRQEDSALLESEVLVTRSRASAPGLAWPGDTAPPGPPIFPAGFIIRLDTRGRILPGYLAAVLNHPSWRLLSAGLAAGKSQDNLSQDTLGTVLIPALEDGAMKLAADRYHEALTEIAGIYADDTEFGRICDEVIAGSLGLVAKHEADAAVECVQIELSAIAATRTLRCDNRWHSSAHAAIRDRLISSGCSALGMLLEELPKKGRQPVWADDDVPLDEVAFTIATGALQAGSVNWELAKATEPKSAERFRLVSGDLLVAMDGVGSLGKAAVFENERVTTVDSHVARAKAVGGAEVADSLACWLNSTWGKTQTNGAMTGSTGQTGLSPTDLIEVLIPEDLASRSQEISAGYRAALRSYDPLPRQARKVLCRVSAELTAQWISEGVIEPTPAVTASSDTDYLMGQYETLYPSIRG